MSFIALRGDLIRKLILEYFDYNSAFYVFKMSSYIYKQFSESQKHKIRCGFVKQNIIENRYDCKCDIINANRNTSSHKRRKKCQYCVKIESSPMKICKVCNVKVPFSHECPLSPNFYCPHKKKLTVRGMVFDFGSCGYSGTKLQVQKHKCKFYCPKCKLELPLHRTNYHGTILKDICPNGLYLCKYCRKHIKGDIYKRHLKQCNSLKRYNLTRDSNINELSDRYI
jgi:hypothetical protein